MKGKVGELVQFLREVKAEGKKVSWASRKHVLAATVVVLVLVFFSALYLGVVDLILAALIRAFLG